MRGAHHPTGGSPLRDVYRDDIAVGTDLPTGAYTVTAQEIVDFASRWDPRFFHADAEAAAEGCFGSSSRAESPR